MVDQARDETALWSIGAEQGLIGRLVTDRSGRAFEACQPLKADDFHDAQHRLIFATIERLAGQDMPHDAPAVIAALGGGAAEAADRWALYLKGCADYAASWGINAEKTARRLRALAKRREIRTAALALGDATEDDGQTLETVLEQAGAALAQIVRGTVRKEPRRLSDVATARTTHYEALQRGDIAAGWPCSIAAINRALAGGFKPGKVYLFGARPAVGKTSLTTQLALDLARYGQPTLILSLEMSAEEIADRGTAHLGQIDYEHLQTGQLTNDDWGRAAAMLDDMARLPVWVDDQGALSLQDIKAKARMVPGLKVLVLDYLQLCSGASDKDNRNNQVEAISRGLKELAMELGIAVIALSQLNRKVEERPGRRPQLADLRDSGSIEQDADVVLLMWPVRELENGGRLVGLGIEKNRQGRTCEIALDFRGDIQRWAESTESLHSRHADEAAPRARGFKS